MAIHTSFFITRPGIDNRSVGQHGAPFVRNIKDISMAFLALIVLKSGICLLTIFLMIVFVQQNDMGKEVFDAVPCLGIEEVKGVMRGGEMTIHTVCHKSLGIIGMGRGFPGIGISCPFLCI